MLKTRSFGRVFEYHEDLDSSNRLLRDQAGQGAVEGSVVLADHQSQGKGRWGRHWESPKAKSLLFSLLLRPPDGKVFSQLSAVLGVALARVLNRRLPPSQKALLKWPNDLWVGERKLSGALLEHVDGAVVAGIGINCLQAAQDFPAELGAVSLNMLGVEDVDREALLADLLLELESCYEGWKSSGFSPFKAEWNANACFIGEMAEAGDLKGRVLGLDDKGALLLEGENGMLVLNSGEIKAFRPLRR